MDHKGPDKREAERDVTTEESVRDVKVDTEAAVMSSEDGGGATDEEHRWPLEAAKAEEHILHSEPPEGTSLADAQ